MACNCPDGKGLDAVLQVQRCYYPSELGRVPQAKDEIDSRSRECLEAKKQQKLLSLRRIEAWDQLARLGVKIRRMRSRLLFLLILFCALLSLAFSSEVEITAEPHHHLVLQNEYIRAFQVEVPPQQATLMHWHRHDYAFVTIGNAEFSNELSGKAPNTVKLQDGETRFLAGDFAHVAKDLASTAFRNVTVEFLRDKRNREASNTKWPEQRGLQILEGGTADILFVKDGVRVTEFQLQPGASVPEDQLATPYLLVAVSDLSLASRKKPLAEFKAGDVKWFAAGQKSALRNSAKQAGRFVTFEF